MKSDFFEKNKGVIGVALAMILLSMTVLGIYLILPQERGDTAEGAADAVTDGADLTYGDLLGAEQTDMIPTAGDENSGATLTPLTPQQGSVNGAEEKTPQPEDADNVGGSAAAPSTEDDTDEAPPTVTWVIQSGSAGLQYRSYGNGTCILEGLGSCTDRCVIIPPFSPMGDTVVAIAAGAFSGSAIEALQIPETVQSIGMGAFEGCTLLALFSVAEGNTAFYATDGVLYSRDGTTLIAYPVGRRCPVAIIPSHVRYIAAMAFRECPSLRYVRYEGSVEGWQEIEIARGNNCLFTLPMSFGADE